MWPRRVLAARRRISASGWAAGAVGGNDVDHDGPGWWRGWWCGGGGGGRGTVHDLIELAQKKGVSNDPLIRQRLAGLYTKSRISKFSSMRTLTAALKGQVPGPEGSIGKLFGGRMMTEMGELAIDLVGVGAVARGDDDYRWHQTLLGAPAAHIAGGSDEVMKNIIGERVLGLPREPGFDPDTPWNEIPRN